MIDRRKLDEIKESIRQCETSSAYSDCGLVEHSKLMLQVIERVREAVHEVEDVDVLLYIAEMLGTNCEPGKDIDD